MSDAVWIGMEAAAAVLGIVLVIHASSEARSIIAAVNDARALADLPPLPARHALDFARIARAYADMTGRGGRVLRTYAASTVGSALFVAGLLPLLPRPPH